jgi:TRAP-type C4-dicarboxylate transport system substrate-binding protein
MLALAAWGATDADAGTRRLKISHQFAEADVRHDFCEVFAEKVKEATNGELEFFIYPASSLYKAKAQYEALKRGALDFSVFPLAYASGKVPIYDITLMPCIITSVEEGMNWRNSKIGKKVEEISEKEGMKILTWLWYAGGIGSKGGPIVLPEDVEGFKMRAAGRQFEYMLNQAGASITSMPSSEIYTALQTGVLDACLTSSTSFMSYRLHEQLDYFNSPENYSIWYMAEPFVVSPRTWKSLSEEHQDAILKVASELYQKGMEDSVEANKQVAKVMRDAGVNVHAMTREEWEKWRDLAKETSWKHFADSVENGQELLDLATE